MGRAGWGRNAFQLICLLWGNGHQPRERERERKRATKQREWGKPRAGDAYDYYPPVKKSFLVGNPKRPANLDTICLGRRSCNWILMQRNFLVPV